MNHDLIIDINCVGLGDVLTYTPIFKYYKNAFVRFIDNDKARKVSILYDGLCKYDFFKDNVGDNINGNVDVATHTAARRLLQLNLGHISPIPKINSYLNYIDKAKDILNNYDLDPNKENLAIVADPAGSHDADLTFGKVRMMDLERWEKILFKLKDKYNLLQFGLSHKTTKLPYTKPILDLDIGTLSACYFIIKKYVGVDTGDYHLMLSVGGKCCVFSPANNEGGIHTYRTWQWHYKPEWFEMEGEKNRANYFHKNFDYKDLKTLNNYILSFL